MSFIGRRRGDGKILVELWDLELAYAALIVEAPTGIVYSNQVGGNGCFHPEVEGYCIPQIPSIIEAPGWMLNWYGGLAHKITPERVQDWIDREVAGGIQIDETRWEKSGEAWIWVKVLPEKPGYLPPSDEPLGELTAVLTWPNTD